MYHTWGPMVVLRGGAVSCERGTPVPEAMLRAPVVCLEPRCGGAVCVGLVPNTIMYTAGLCCG